MSAPAHLPDAPVTPEAAWQLLARVAHDLRGPLTVIMGTAQLLQANPSSDADAVASILGAARKMQTMLDRLTEQAQRAHGESLSEPLQTSGVAYTTGIVTVLGEALGQPVQVVSAVSGAASDGWPVVLRLDLADLLTLARGHAEAAARAWGRAVSPLLTWTGAALRLQWPMPDGSGPERALEVPATAATESALWPRDLARPDPLPTGRLSPSGHAIWLAEDHAAVRELLVRVLSDWGFGVRAWADGQFLIDQLRAEADTPPDLVLTDLTMPGATGHNVLEACRALHPALPVVLLSGTQSLTLGAFAPHGAVWFDAALTKPIDWRRLRYTLQELLRLPLAAASGGATTAPELKALRDALAMGAVTDVLDLARSQAEKHGPDADFWATVVALVHNGDLDALEACLLSHPTARA